MVCLHCTQSFLVKVSTHVFVSKIPLLIRSPFCRILPNFVVPQDDNFLRKKYFVHWSKKVDVICKWRETRECCQKHFGLSRNMQNVGKKKKNKTRFSFFMWQNLSLKSKLPKYNMILVIEYDNCRGNLFCGLCTRVVPYYCGKMFQSWYLRSMYITNAHLTLNGLEIRACYYYHYACYKCTHNLLSHLMAEVSLSKNGDANTK